MYWLSTSNHLVDLEYGLIVSKNEEEKEYFKYLINYEQKLLKECLFLIWEIEEYIGDNKNHKFYYNDEIDEMRKV